MMDMPMKDGMEKEKKPMFKCPNCNCSLEVMKDETSDKKPMKKDASNMPFGELRNKITPPNTNSF